MPACLQPTSDGVLIRVHLQPRASRNELAGLHGDRLKIRLTAPPVDSKANESLLEFLAGLLKVPRAQLELVRGEKSRAKEVLVCGVSLADASAMLLPR